MRIAFLSWRDLTHPEGGGAERYAQTICAGLAARGHDVTLLCADHGGAPVSERLDGYRILRQGGRLTVYPAAVKALRHLERSERPFDVVIDTQNGIPFASTLGTRSPVVVLLHHVHREQWPVAFPSLQAKIGWFLESEVAPPLYRRNQYVTVSSVTRDELVELGIGKERIAVIHNGTDRPIAEPADRSRTPRIVVLGRLVPHKRVELAVDVVSRLRDRIPGLRLRIIGDGWWHDEIADHIEATGASDLVDQLGFVDEQTKHDELAQAWLALAPSAKEGWGLNVVEAAAHGVPTIAFHGAGGLSESILDGVTGQLVDDVDAMTEATAALLADHAHREDLGAAARIHAEQFTWGATVDRWETLLTRVAAGEPPVGEVDRVVVSPGVVVGNAELPAHHPA